MSEKYSKSTETTSGSQFVKLSKFDQLKLWIVKEQESNRSKHSKVAETGITPIKEFAKNSLSKLRSGVEKKSIQNMAKRVSAIGAVIMLNLGNVNPAEAKANVKIQSEPTKIEQVVNTEVSTNKAQKLKTQFGFEKLSDSDYAKILKATNSDAENVNDIRQRQSESKAKGIQNSDGTLNRQRAVNQLHLNYLRNIEPMAAPIIGENIQKVKAAETTVKEESNNTNKIKAPVVDNSKKPEKSTVLTNPTETKQTTVETPKPVVLKTEAILESGKFNINSPAIQKLIAYLGITDLASDEQFNKFNTFIKTNITKGEGTMTVKNSTIEEYIKSNPTRPVVTPTKSPEPVKSPEPSKKVDLSPTPTPKPENVNKSKKAEQVNYSEAEKYKSYWEGDNFKNEAEKQEYIRHTIKEINILIRDGNLNAKEAEYLQNGYVLDRIPLIYVGKRWDQDRSQAYNSESDKKDIVGSKKWLITELKKLNL